MNERIQELAEQTGIFKPNEFHQHIDALQLEKFAELIVKECASICELNGQSYTHSFTPAKARLAESTSNHCGLMIKKHFGVEE
jgi:hypothetical protein